MLYTLFNVIYVLVAVAMTAFILLQQGSGASAGSGFGAGASATVFGARGSANFLSKSTAILATIFMAMSLGMAIYLHKTSGSASQRTMFSFSTCALTSLTPSCASQRRHQ